MNHQVVYEHPQITPSQKIPLSQRRRISSIPQHRTPNSNTMRSALSQRKKTQESDYSWMYHKNSRNTKYQQEDPEEVVDDSKCIQYWCFGLLALVIIGVLLFAVFKVHHKFGFGQKSVEPIQTHEPDVKIGQNTHIFHSRNKEQTLNTQNKQIQKTKTSNSIEPTSVEEVTSTNTIQPMVAKQSHLSSFNFDD